MSSRTTNAARRGAAPRSRNRKRPRALGRRERKVKVRPVAGDSRRPRSSLRRLAQPPAPKKRCDLQATAMRLLVTAVILFRCLTAWPSAGASPSVSVRIKQGELRGETLTSVEGKTYASFKGIPYVAAPIGELRFKPPQPLRPWNGVRDALKEGPHCLQANMGSEDCLYLNVYTSEIPSAKSSARPVMVWFHEGGFSYGSGDSSIYGPDYLVGAGVVIVTVNYRLSILGFMSLDNDEVPGNMGLKDQVAALKWVQENIAVFGGDPRRVTISGVSAGGVSVHFHMLSPLSKGLFHKAISQSGSALNPFSISTKNKERAFAVGEKVGCTRNNTKDLLSCLMKANATALIAAAETLFFPEDENVMVLKVRFSPNVEPKSNGAFILEHPATALRAGRFHHVPLIMGLTNREGILGALFVRAAKSGWLLMNTKFEDQLPEIPIPTQEFASTVKEFYFRNKPLSEENIDKFIDFHTDFGFLEGIHRSVKQTAALSRQNVYFYIFKFDGALGFLRRNTNISDFRGAAHADDIGYLFDAPEGRPNVTADSPEMKTLRRMVKLWTNFAKFGNPTPVFDEDLSAVWQPFGKDDTCYFSIDAVLSMGCDLSKERLKFWEDLYKGKP